ncbi:MAG: hypothetical protein WAM28_00230 [Chlamydiales bacterium]
MAGFQEFEADLPLLVEAGLVAIKQGDEESAKKLFNAVSVIAPENMAKKMGYGLIALHKMDTKSAQKQFQEVIQVEKDNYRAKAFLALSYILSVMQDGSSDEKLKALQTGAQLAQEVVEKSDSPSTQQLAQSLLDWESQLQEKVESP